MINELVNEIITKTQEFKNETWSKEEIEYAREEYTDQIVTKDNHSLLLYLAEMMNVELFKKVIEYK